MSYNWSNEYNRVYPGQMRPGDRLATFEQIKNIQVGFAISINELVEFLYNLKVNVAYGGLTIKKGDDTFLFQTDFGSITLCSTKLEKLKNKDDSYETIWKTWENGLPKFVKITKAELQAISDFGDQVAQAAFELQGKFNIEAQAFTDQQLTNEQVINEFKQRAELEFSQINRMYQIVVQDDQMFQPDLPLSSNIDIINQIQNQQIEELL